MKIAITEKKAETIDKMSKLYRHPLELSLCILMVSIVVITFLQVLFRYVFQISLAWTEELARYAFMWTAALSVGYAFKTKSHFALKFLVDRFGFKIRKLMSSIVTFLTVTFLVIFTWKSIQYVQSASNQIAPGTGLSMVIPYSSMVCAGLLMLFYVIKNWREEMFSKTEKQEL